MAEVVLASSSGGIINQSLVEDLRGDKVTGDAKTLADLGSFIDGSGNAPKKGEYDADFEAAFQAGKAIWGALADELEAGVDVARLRDKLLLPLLRALGFEPQFQRAHLAAPGGTYRISHLGWDGADAPPLILEPDAPEQRTRSRRSTHDEMQAYLNAADVDWGIVSDGRVLRVLRDFHHTRTKGYVQFDLAAIFTAGSTDDFRSLWRLCHASRFRSRPHPETGDPPPGDRPQAHCLLEQLHERSVTAGVTAGKRLQPQVRFAIEQLANGALAGNPELRQKLENEAEFGRTLYGELLSVLYRTLFLLFAEQRNMLRTANDLYDETYSLARLRQVAEERSYEGRRFDLWEGLKATFSAFHDPARGEALGVYPYNGELFDPERTPHLTTARIANRHVAAAIRSLTTVEVGKVTLHVDYRNLGVEELGTVYESLLDYTLRVAAAPTAIEGRSVNVGEAYLNPLSTERADLASYYTPPALVSLVLDRALDPLLEERLVAAGSTPAARRAALLDLRVIDPACGSGAFLIGAIDRIALAVARERTSPSEPADVDVSVARRDVLSHCIYGADKDPFAVELCKVALWIHCALADAPLNFLDHHIVCGDSLVGWPMFDVPTEIPSDAFDFKKAQGDTKKLLAAARKANNDYLAARQRGLFDPPAPDLELALPKLLEADESTLADVRAKADAYAEYLMSDAHQAALSAADLWTGAFFWTADSGTPPITREYHSALGGEVDPDLITEVRRVVLPLNPLHWPLAFPDIRERGGFDLVIGNPPWEQFKGEELNFFAETAPQIAELASKPRKLAIEKLAEDDPGLFERWLRYQSAQDRLAHYAKSTPRYTRTRSEANTYVLFVELAAQLTERRGGAGVVVKSGIAIDSSPSAVWRRLLTDGRLREAHDIVNGGATGTNLIFPGVDAKERFTVLVLGPERVDEDSFAASTMAFNLVEAADVSRSRTWAKETLKDASPFTLTLLSARHDWENDLAIAIQARHQPLDFDSSINESPSNPWDLRFTGLFHSSGAQDHFHRREDLEHEGFVLQTSREMLHPDGRWMVPVFEGQMVNRWDHRAKTYEGYRGSNKYGRAPGIPWVSDEQHSDACFEVEPRYWMLQKTADDRVSEALGDRALVAYRDVTRPWREQRSIKAALLFPTPATDKLPILGTPKPRALKLVALLNSMTFDFLARLHVPGASVKSWVLSQCAAPAADEIPERAGQIAEVLSVTSAKLAGAYGLSVHDWDAENRRALEAEADALIALAYRLTRDEYERVFEHFEVMQRVEDERFGEYRTKRLCLEAWDRLAKESA